MQKRSSKRQDINELASSIARQATDGTCHEKNPAAVALGRLGSLKGSKARAASLSGEKRSEIARKAARARWGR